MVTISLPKEEYKMYEPVWLHYEWINYKDKPDSIWALFSSTHYMKYFITDDKGNTYEQRLPEIALIGYTLTDVVNKNDTLKRAAIINHYGKKFEDYGRRSIFHLSAYFPPGEYTVYSVIDEDVPGKYPKPIITNKVQFEVVELSKEEEEVIRLAEAREFEKALLSFPDNYFKEHLMDAVLWKKIREFVNAGETNNTYKDTSTLASDYKTFFDMYPNSMYNQTHIIFYLKVSSRDSASAVERMNELIAQYPNSNLSTLAGDIIKTEKRKNRSLIYMMGTQNQGNSETTIPSGK